LDGYDGNAKTGSVAYGIMGGMAEAITGEHRVWVLQWRFHLAGANLPDFGF